MIGSRSGDVTARGEEAIRCRGRGRSKGSGQATIASARALAPGST